MCKEMYEIPTGTRKMGMLEHGWNAHWSQSYRGTCPHNETDSYRRQQEMLRSSQQGNNGTTLVRF